MKFAGRLVSGCPVYLFNVWYSLDLYQFFVVENHNKFVTNLCVATKNSEKVFYFVELLDLIVKKWYYVLYRIGIVYITNFISTMRRRY